MLKLLVISLFLYRSSAGLKGAASEPSHPEQAIRHHLWHIQPVQESNATLNGSERIEKDVVHLTVVVLCFLLSVWFYTKCLKDNYYHHLKNPALQGAILIVTFYQYSFNL